MWQASEKEKDKIKTAKHGLKGCRQNVVTNNEAVPNTSKGTLYMKYRSFFAGRCGQCITRVRLRKNIFLSSPVAVKYFETSIRAKFAEREAFLLTHYNFATLTCL